ncbi:MAG: hypothetical protein V1929_03465 [bacterium]
MKTAEELIAEIQAIRKAHPEEMTDAVRALSRYVLWLFSKTPTARPEEFESWAQLKWAGNVIDQAAGGMRAQRDLLVAAGELLMVLVSQYGGK